MKKSILISSLQETNQLGEQIGHMLQPNMVITLAGDLGAGKTTLTKAIGKAMGIQKVINSPTFTILKVYEGKLPLYHIDAYRLEEMHQDLGFEEYIDGDGVCIIEWPSYIAELIPKNHLEIEILLQEQQRIFTFTATGDNYIEMVRNLK